MRVPVNHNQDANYFRRTASHSKAVNLGFNIMRGGIRF